MYDNATEPLKVAEVITDFADEKLKDKKETLIVPKGSKNGYLDTSGMTNIPAVDGYAKVYDEVAVA